jgi:hypothetical protein
MSFCRGIIHAPAQRLHLPLQVCRRELLSTAFAEAGSVATTASLSCIRRLAPPVHEKEGYHELRLDGILGKSAKGVGLTALLVRVCEEG